MGQSGAITAAEAARLTKEARERYAADQVRQAKEAEDRRFRELRSKLLNAIHDSIAKRIAFVMGEVDDLPMRKRIIEHFRSLGYEANTVGPGSAVWAIERTPLIKISWSHLLGGEESAD